MATAALLVGFIYPQEKRKLAGCLVDLYLFYQYISKQNFTTVLLATDLRNDPPVEDYREAITNGVVDVNILSFISCRRRDNQLILINSNKDLLEFIETNLRKTQKFVLYLTGHGHEYGFACPQGFVSWSQLQNSVFGSLRPNTQGFIVLDACHGCSFQLPFELTGEEEKYLFKNTGFFPTPQVVILTSLGEKAATTPSGSLVTSALIKALQKGCCRYFYLRKSVEKELAATATLREMNLHLAIYASYPSLLQIWRWLLNQRCFYCFEEGFFIDLTK